MLTCAGENDVMTHWSYFAASSSFVMPASSAGRRWRRVISCPQGEKVTRWSSSHSALRRAEASEAVSAPSSASGAAARLGFKPKQSSRVRDRQELADAVQAEYQAYYEKHTQVKTQPYDGIPELLHALAERGLKLAVLSNKPDADTKNVISHFFPDVPFGVVRGQVEGVPVKPDKAGALLVAEQLGIAPADFLYLGDTKVDMTCACSAGMNPVGVLWGFRTAQELLDNGAKVLIAHPMELLEKFNL